MVTIVFCFWANKGLELEKNTKKVSPKMDTGFCMRRIVGLASKLSQHVLDDVSVDVREPPLKAIVVVAKPFVVQAE